MTYKIEENSQYGSREIRFSEKPCEEVIEALKRLKLRWCYPKRCWYGYAPVEKIVAAISEATPKEEQSKTSILTEGYMGGGAYYGGKSHLSLYGQDLKKAIAEDIKRAGIKGVTLAIKNGNIRATVAITAEDIISLEEYIAGYNVSATYDWVTYFDDGGVERQMHIKDYYNLPGEMQRRLKRKIAAYQYAKEVKNPCNINIYHIDKYNGFTEIGKSKINAVQDIIAAYRYDGSNSMVDYYDTNFYYEIKTKPTFINIEREENKRKCSISA